MGGKLGKFANGGKLAEDGVAHGRRHRWVGVILLIGVGGLLAQETAPAPRPDPAPDHFVPPAPWPCDRPLPINLPTALKLANVQNLDIVIASERIRVAAADLERAKVLWLPTLYLGGDYLRHDGQIQNEEGKTFTISKGSLMGGVGPSMVFAVADAIFEPLAARQVVHARQATLQAQTNDTMLAVAEAYFTVQQARGELAGNEDTVRRTEDIVHRAEKLAEGGLVPPVETTRARTELARRRVAANAARERWRVVGADLLRLLRLDAAALVEPIEPPALQVTLVPPGPSVDDLICQALTNRPELAAQQALVQAALRRIKEEKLRPLMPSVLLRGAGTSPAGTLSSGVFGGGVNNTLSDFTMRNTMDLQVLWELQNFGYGNHARVHAREAERDLSVSELFRLQDRVAAEVVQAYEQVQLSAARIGDAEQGLRDALDSATKNIEGMSQTKRPGGNITLLVIRPQEAVAAVQALGSAYSDYYGAVADYNRAQFRLYRALGNPAQTVVHETECPAE
jgi:outer membrane protein TolC